MAKLYTITAKHDRSVFLAAADTMAKAFEIAKLLNGDCRITFEAKSFAHKPITYAENYKEY